MSIELARKETKGPTLVHNPKHPSYELVYDVLIGIRNAVVEGYAKRAAREEELDLNFEMPLIVLLPKDFAVVNRFSYSKYKIQYNLFWDFFKTIIKFLYRSGVNDEDDTTQRSETYLYSFKFHDYAPFVFSNIRAFFGFNTAEYLVTIKFLFHSKIDIFKN